MLKKLPLFCLFTLLFSANVFGQEIDSVNAVKPYGNVAFLELGANSGIGLSGNYERHFPIQSKQKLTLTLRFGYGVSAGYISEGVFSIAPIEVSLFGGNRYVKPELGIGTAFIDDPYNPSQGAPFIPRAGIRLQKPGKHFLCKINVATWILKENENSNKFTFIPIPGIVLGYSFGK